MPDEVRLNLGCGFDIREGWYNGDLHPVTGARAFDVTLPWLWAPEAVDTILISHVMEHVPPDSLNGIMLEAWRVLKPGGTLEIRVPFYRCYDAIEDPTHVRVFELGSFRHLLRPTPRFLLDLKFSVHPSDRIRSGDTRYSPRAYRVRGKIAEAVGKVLTWLMVQKKMRWIQEWIPRWLATEWIAKFRKPL